MPNSGTFRPQILDFGFFRPSLHHLPKRTTTFQTYTTISVKIITFIHSIDVSVRPWQGKGKSHPITRHEGTDGIADTALCFLEPRR